MQYAVYLHPRQAQGASVASVYVTWREGRKREQRKQVGATPDSPSTFQEQLFPQPIHPMQTLGDFRVNALEQRMCNFQTCLCALSCF